MSSASRLRALQDHAGVGLVRGEFDGAVQERLIGDDARALDAAARGQDHLGFRVVDAGGELFRGEAAEHHRMDGADARAGQHGEHRLRDHRHVDDDAVALGDAEVAQHRAEQLHLGEHAAVGEGLDGVGDRRIVDQRHLVVAPVGDVAVEAVVAGVAGGALVPAAVDAGLRVEHFFRRLEPVDVLGGLRPEALRVALPLGVDVLVAAGAGIHVYSLLTSSSPHPEERRGQRRVSKDERSPGGSRASPFETPAFAKALAGSSG